MTYLASCGSGRARVEDNGVDVGVRRAMGDLHLLKSSITPKVIDIRTFRVQIPSNNMRTEELRSYIRVLKVLSGLVGYFGLFGVEGWAAKRYPTLT